jgi:hypothetical protein
MPYAPQPDREIKKRIYTQERNRKISDAMKGNKNGRGNKGRTGHTPWNKGLTGIYSDAAIKAMKLAKLGKKGKQSNPWKGENASYSAIHKWLRVNYGKATVCVMCGKAEGRLHWANKDHSYRRTIDDYMPLCPPCHKEHDSKLMNNQYAI